MAEKSHQDLVKEWLNSQEEGKKKKKKGRRLPDSGGGVTINSLMDAMFIILVFLLMNYAIDPLRIDISEDLKLPPSTSDVNPEPTAAITISAKGIIVNDKVVVDVKGGTVSKIDKQGAENSLQIQPLFEALNEEVTRQKNIAQLNGTQFSGILTVICHQETPYRLLTEVLYTAGQAEFRKFKFAILQGGARGVSG